MFLLLYLLLTVIYFVLLFTLGIVSIRKGHWVIFLIGIAFPPLWVVGALMRPATRLR
ncbi:MAG TPA: hypothetical protein VFN50_04455 [Acidimicrobiales bacterium]|nr:hypothetical protein [Acidimicrobiales bacterium]